MQKGLTVNTITVWPFYFMALLWECYANLKYLSKSHCLQKYHRANACKYVFYRHKCTEAKMRKLTQAELRIVELLAHGVRPKRNCASSLCFLRHSSVASWKFTDRLFGAHYTRATAKNQCASIYWGSAVSKFEAVTAWKTSVRVIHAQLYVSADFIAIRYECKWSPQTLWKNAMEKWMWIYDWADCKV